MKLKPYPSYKDSEVEWLGSVPDEWSVKPLKHIASVNDDVLSELTEPEEEIEYVDIGSVTFECGIEKTEVMKFSAAPSRARRKVRDGDVIVSTVRTYLKAIAPIINPPSNLVCSTGFAVVRPNQNLNPTFAKYSMQTEYFIGEVIARSVGVSYPAINSSDMMCIRMTAPPLHDQAIISAFLDRETGKLDTLIAKQEHLIELLQEKRQAIISHAVTKGLNPDAKMKDSGVEWLGMVPEGWKVGTLARVSNRIVVGIAEAAAHAYVENGVPILRSTNIRAGKIIGEILHIDAEFAKDRGSKLIRANDLITVRTGNAGVSAVVPNELDNCQCFTMLITSLRSSNSPQFYCYWLNSYAAKCYFGLEGWGTAQINISVPILKDMPLVIPTFSEQSSIVKFLDKETFKIDTLIDKAKRSIELAKEHRTALISAAVTGKIDVREAV